MKKISIIFFMLFALTNNVFAQRIDGSNANSLVQSLTLTFNKTIVPLLILIGFAYVIFAAVQYIAANEDEKAREEKKQKMFWGIIGLFVILSVWSLVFVVSNTFGIFVGGSLS